MYVLCCVVLCVLCTCVYLCTRFVSARVDCDLLGSLIRIIIKSSLMVVGGLVRIFSVVAGQARVTIKNGHLHLFKGQVHVNKVERVVVVVLVGCRRGS
jgi:hypothetical protein